LPASSPATWFMSLNARRSMLSGRGPETTFACTSLLPTLVPPEPPHPASETIGGTHSRATRAAATSAWRLPIPSGLPPLCMNLRTMTPHTPWSIRSVIPIPDILPIDYPNAPAEPLDARFPSGD